MFGFVDRALWILTAALSAAVFLRLHGERIAGARPYQLFAAMLLAGMFRDFVLWFIAFDDHAYTRAWSLTTCAMLATHGFAAFGCYRAVAKLGPRIRDFEVSLFSVAFFVAAVLSCFPILFETEKIEDVELELRTVFLLLRLTDTAAAALLIVAFVYLRACAVPPPANLARHTLLLAAYFTTYGLSYFLSNFYPLDSTFAVWNDRACSLIVACLYLSWLGLVPEPRTAVAKTRLVPREKATDLLTVAEGIPHTGN